MLLYLLRHAEAERIAAKDELRVLSDKGRRQARDVARFCLDHELIPDLILASPLLRARETAQIVAGHVECEMVVEPWLTSGMSPEEALEELRAHQRRAGVMLVGHEPDFSRLAAHLLGIADAGGLHVRKASLTGIELPALRAGAGTLEFLVPVRFM